MKHEELNYDDVVMLMDDRCPSCHSEVFLTDLSEGVFELICPTCKEIYTIGGIASPILEKKSHINTEIEQKKFWTKQDIYGKG